jgi:nitrite reductase/ring-hydroxylating ferredoxin subunit
MTDMTLGERRPQESGRQWVRVGPAAALPPGQSVSVDIDGSRIALFHEDGRYHAVDEACLHQGGPLSEGCVDRGVVTCPWHGWRYDLRSGERVDRRGSPIGVYPVQLDDGWIAIGV